MSSLRHDVRLIVIQALYENDFLNNLSDSKKVLETYNRIAKENMPPLIDNEFAKTLIEGTVVKLKEIDRIIEKVAPEWPIKKTQLVDRNVLRLGIFELLFGKEFDTPGRVAINEAIELGKKFGGQSTPKFINGILGTVYKETGGEDEKIEKVEKKYVGAIVYTFNEGKLKIALVHDIFRKWTISKGQIIDIKNPYGELLRVIKEEIGIDIEPKEEIGSNSYISHPPEGPVRKSVTYFLAKAKNLELKLKDSEGLLDVKWFAEKELKDLQMYQDMKDMIFDSVTKIKENKKEYE